MPRAVPAAATLLKNALDEGRALLELWRVDVGGAFLNIVNNPEPILYGGITYQPYPVQRQDEEQSATGKIAQMVVLVSNVTREPEGYIQATDLRGKTVERRIVDPSNLTWDIMDSMSIDSYETDDTHARFVLMKPIPAAGLKFPTQVLTREDFPAIPE
jgi:phage-related protein